MGIYYVTIINGLEKVISRKGGHYNSFYNWNRKGHCNKTWTSGMQGLDF